MRLEAGWGELNVVELLTSRRMKTLFLFLLVFGFFNSAFGDLYHYPKAIEPKVSLRKACEIAEAIFEGQKIEGYYLLETKLYGNKAQDGGGAWNLIYWNANGDRVHVSIHLREDFCYLERLPKIGKSSAKGYTRDGSISEKWREWERKAAVQEDPFAEK